MSNCGYTDQIQELFKGVVGNSPFGILVLGITGEVSIINGLAVNLLGFEGRKAVSLVDESYTSVFQHTPELLDKYERLILNNRKRAFDVSSVKQGGYDLMIKCRAMAKGALVILEDRQALNELEHAARYDGLTQVLNRKVFLDRLDQHINTGQISEYPGALLFIDLDRFKPVNDVAGHAAGDDLLRRIANIITSRTRVDDSVARIGGDEFCVLLENCSLPVGEQIADSIRDDVDKLAIHHDGHHFSVSASIGIVSLDSKFKRATEIVNAADTACRTAKHRGRNNVVVLDIAEGGYEHMANQSEILSSVNAAMDRNGFSLYRQEIRSIASPSVKHWEILMRMQASDGKVLSPGFFLPAVERYQVMPDVDRWVLKRVFEHAVGSEVYAVNLSGQTICQPAFVSYIEALLERYAVDTSKIIFEITESAALSSLEATTATIHQLKDKGFRFSLDDFGTGFSSYRYLSKMPVDYLKIDGSFIKDISVDKTMRAIVRSMNDIGHAMNMKTVAEFVEDAATASVLQEIGVDFAQGYYVHKPECLIHAYPLGAVAAA